MIILSNYFSNSLKFIKYVLIFYITGCRIRHILPDQKPNPVETVGSTKKISTLDLSQMNLNAWNIRDSPD